MVKERMEQLKKLVCSRASNKNFDVTVTYQRSAEAAATIGCNGTYMEKAAAFLPDQQGADQTEHIGRHRRRRR